MGSGGSVRSFGPIRSVVVSVVLCLFAASCAADPSLTDEVAVEASDAATSGTDAGGADDPAESSAPEPATDDDGTDAAAPDEVPSDEPEPEAPAVRPETVVTWLDTEFLLPGPWSLLATEGGAILLEHPSAAGPGGSVYVTLFAADGQLSAAQLMDVRPLLTASGEILETRELDAVFATGGPGLQAGASTSQLVSIYSDTGISVSISREEGLLTEEAVATVLALLATIEPPAVTPSTEAVGGWGAAMREIGLDIPRDTCALYNDPATPPDAAGNFDGHFKWTCNTTDPTLGEAANDALDDVLSVLTLCPGRREAVRNGPPPGYALWYPDGRVERDCTWRPKSGD